MRFADVSGGRTLLLCVALGGAAGCDVVYPLSFFDEVPHLRADQERLGDFDLELPALTINTSDTISPSEVIQNLVLEVAEQSPDGGDLAVMRVRDLRIVGDLTLRGSRPFVIVARSITLAEGVKILANATHDIAGAGGDLAGAGTVGEGASGARAGLIHTGGGGGGFAGEGGSGGGYACEVDGMMQNGGGGGALRGEATLPILEGGGAGGSGGSDCGLPMLPGGGGGAIQLSARESIVIERGAEIRADGGGGGGGKRCSVFEDAGGSGGGAGGAIYLDAPTIDNTGTVTANGGGGGGGADRMDGNGVDGQDGVVVLTAAPGGFGNPPRGTTGGNGSTAGNGGGAESGGCLGFNTGGGGGAAGRIVFRGVTILLGQMVSPMPEQIDRVPEVP